MDAQKQQVVAKLKEAKNVLVTVSADPSVDQLAACLGLTLMLNKLGKHATAVFSGQVPSTIEFLQPEETLESNTNSLRDFIIALDRNKADKLRYKVEDKVVRIFITPYKTSISQDDLQFSEGDFNVDVVVGLGVKQQQDIDQAVTAQGNILHDATVITMTTSDESSLGSIHWRDPEASGVSELAASISDSFDKNLLDEQIATAFLTGIVAQTERFSNTLTTSKTMTISAQLMSAGANQQLVATQLEEPAPPPEPEPAELPEPENSDNDDSASDEPNEPPKDDEKNNDGALEIDHSQADEETPENPSDDQPSEPESSDSAEQPSDESSDPSTEKASASDDEKASDNDDTDKQDQSSRKVLRGEGPTGGQLTANSKEEPLDPSTDPFSLPPLDQPLMEHNFPSNEDEAKPAEELAPEEPQPEPEPTPEPQPEPPKLPETNEPESPTATKQTLDDIETSVHSPHHAQASATPEPKPEASTFSAPVPEPQPEPAEDQLPSVSVDSNGLLIHHNGDEPELQTEFKPAPGFGSGQSPLDMPSPNNLSMAPPLTSSEDEPNSGNPPPVPPPMTPQAG